MTRTCEKCGTSFVGEATTPCPECDTANRALPSAAFSPEGFDAPESSSDATPVSTRDRLPREPPTALQSETVEQRLTPILGHPRSDAKPPVVVPTTRQDPKELAREREWERVQLSRFMRVMPPPPPPQKGEDWSFSGDESTLPPPFRAAETAPVSGERAVETRQPQSAKPLRSGATPTSIPPAAIAMVILIFFFGGLNYIFLRRGTAPPDTSVIVLETESPTDEVEEFTPEETAPTAVAHASASPTVSATVRVAVAQTPSPIASPTPSSTATSVETGTATPPATPAATVQTTSTPTATPSAETTASPLAATPTASDSPQPTSAPDSTATPAATSPPPDAGATLAAQLVSAAKARYGQGDLSGAVEVLLEARDRFPTYAETYWWLASVYNIMPTPRIDDACAAWRRYLELDPNGSFAPTARRNLGACP